MPQVFVVNSPVFNAGTLGTNDDSFIMVHSALVDQYTDEELLTVIGHECGHIHNSHVAYLTALHYLTYMAGMFLPWILQPALVALRTWSRRAEITCDRAGMLVSGDQAAAERAITKLAVGSRKLYEEFNLDAFLEQHEEGSHGIGKYMEVFATHPWLPKRVLAMRVFGESQLFHTAVGQPADGPDDERGRQPRRRAAQGGRVMTINGQSGATTPARPALDTFFARRDEIVETLRGLGDVASSLGTKSLRDRVDRELVRKLDEDRFHLVVVGEFNHGKTHVRERAARRARAARRRDADDGDDPSHPLGRDAARRSS